LLYGFDTHELFRRPRLHAPATAGSLDREPAFDRHRSRSKRQQLLRSPFLTSLGTTVLTIATGYLAGSSIPAVNRLISTVVGALIGLLATVIIPAPKPQEQSGSSAAADRGTDTE
jgi:hypothetical protein